MQTKMNKFKKTLNLINRFYKLFILIKLKLCMKLLLLLALLAKNWKFIALYTFEIYFCLLRYNVQRIINLTF